MGKSCCTTDVLISAILEEVARLQEGKAYGSRSGDFRARASLLKQIGVDASTAKSARSSSWKSFKLLQDKFTGEMLSHVGQFHNGSLSKTGLKNKLKVGLRDAYYKSFIAGLKSSGHSQLLVSTYGDPSSGKTVPLSPSDKKFIESAYRHEAQFMTRFIGDITAGRGTMPYTRRMAMYGDALFNMFLSGRLHAAPSDIVIHWVTSGNKTVCSGCRLMRDWSPFTKDRIPTLPKSGSTKCLTNCHCRIVIKQAKSPNELRKIRNRLPSTETMLRRLRDAKSKP